MPKTRSLLPAFRHACWMKPGLLAFVLLITLVAPASSSSAGPALFNIELSGDIQANGEVYSVDLSPDATRVVFNGDLEFDGMSELYSTPTRGGERVRLSGDHLINGGNVANDFQVAPNSQRAVFRTDKEQDEVTELWSVPVSGGMPIKLNHSLTFFEDVSGFTISPDSQYVVYTTTANDEAPVNIWSVPIAGGWQAKLNGDAGSNGMAYGPRVSADSRWVVYLMRYPDQWVTHLYSVPIYGSITGTDRVRLNETPVSGAAGVGYFEITPNSERVVYRASLDRMDTYELYSVPLRGPAAAGTKLNPDYEGNQYLSSFKITPDSSRVVYRADQNVDNRVELYSVPSAGEAAPVRLTGMVSFTDAEGGVEDDFQITPNSLGAVFRVNPAYANSYDLYAVALDGSAWRKLNPALTSTQTVSNFKITPSSWGVVFRSNFSGDYQLYSTDMFATQRWQLTNASDWQFINTPFQITPNSQYVAYLADLDADNAFDLYSFPIRGTDPARTLRWNLPFALPESDINGFILSPGSSSLVYTADREIDDHTQIYYAYYAYPAFLPYTSR